MTLEEFVESGFVPESHNGQLARILGRNMLPDVRQNYDSSIVAEAKESLEHSFTFAGITERFDKSMLLIAMAMGWDDVFYRSQGVNTQRPKSEQLTNRQTLLIEQCNQMDLKIYDFAVSLLNRRVQEIVGFERLLVNFCEANRRNHDLIKGINMLSHHKNLLREDQKDAALSVSNIE